MSMGNFGRQKNPNSVIPLSTGSDLTSLAITSVAIVIFWQLLLYTIPVPFVARYNVYGQLLLNMWPVITFMASSVVASAIEPKIEKKIHPVLRFHFSCLQLIFH